MEGSSFSSSGKAFAVGASMSCDVGNVKYVLACNGCRHYYVGRAGDTLGHRRAVHGRRVRGHSTGSLPLGRHLDECWASEPEFEIFPFCGLYSEGVSARLAGEKHCWNFWT